MLIANLSLSIKCGPGGSGSIDYRDHKEKIKPLGGSGGNGGSVKFEVSDRVHDLSHLTSSKVIKTSKGGDGGKKYKNGQSGEDIILRVPPGTRVTTEEDGLVADLINLGSTYKISNGGKGGRGNFELANKKNIAPKFAEVGEMTYKKICNLDLALISDVAIVGFPNAGKSSLIKAITNSKAVVADYPFTTKTPNIGIITENSLNLRVIDLPGLIGEASEGKGLGKEILKHLAGTKLILYVLDPSPLQELSIEEQYLQLNNEIYNYDKTLNQINKVAIVNKVDLFPEEPFGDYMQISCKEKSGIDYLFNEFNNLSKNEILALPSKRVHYELTKPKFDTHEIQEVDNTWKIYGSEIDKICNIVGNDEDINNEIMRRFEESGLEDELKSLGVKNGDTIILRNQEFVFKV